MADLNGKQGIAWRYLSDDTHSEILYGGAAGGGKSWLGALWLLTNAIRYQGSRWLMGRAVAKTLKETTLNSFFDVCSAHGLRAGEHYTYNQQTGQIAVGASTILLKDLFAYPSDPNFDDLGSLEITGAFIDEANQVTEKAKAIVSSRIRYKLDEFGLVPKLLMTCNPARNWVYSQFYLPHRDGTIAPHRAFVPALVTDNPNISPHYVDNLRRLTGPDRERLLLGNWDYDNDPARLCDMDAINDLWTNEHVEGGKRYISADIAGPGRDKTVYAVWDGLRVIHWETMDVNDGPQAIEALRRLAVEYAVPRSHIVIDADGIGGMGVADHFKGCCRFNAQAKAIEDKGRPLNFNGLKVQCYYKLAELVNDGAIRIVPTEHRDRIAEELAWVKTAAVDKDGKLRILGKDKVKEGIGRSPDFADALMMRMIFEVRKADVGLVDYLRTRGRTYRKDAYMEQWREAVKQLK